MMTKKMKALDEICARMNKPDDLNVLDSSSDIRGVDVKLNFPLDGTAILVGEVNGKAIRIAQCADTEKLKAYAASRGAVWTSIF